MAPVLAAAVFLFPRLDTVPVVVLLFSEEVFEVPVPLFALRVLLLRAMGISGNVPTIGVAVLEARPARVVTGAGVAMSISMPSGSCDSASSCFKAAVVTVVSKSGSSVVSCGVDPPLMEALSRLIPAACSNSVMTLLLLGCCTECDDKGRSTGSSGATETTELAVEFLRARTAVGRSVMVTFVLGNVKLPTIGEEAG